MIKKIRLKIGIVVVIIGMTSFSDWTFAVEGNDFEILGIGINTIVAILSWIWVFFAKLAGTFLTNKWVYGEVLGLDVLLWKFRNMMKNIANFGLGFYFVYIIAKGIIKQGKEDITKKLKDIILRLLIAGVGIQTSWFFTSVVIDVSTITLAAAGAFPSQIIAGSPQVEKSMKQSLSAHLDSSRKYAAKGKEITIFPTDAKASSFIKQSIFKVDSPQDFSGFVDKLMPNADDVSGPLYFMGFSILKTDVLSSLASDSVKGTKATILNIIIQGGTTIVYAIEMFILCIIALIRILYLRMFIVLSPLAVLIWCIGKSGEKLGNHGFLNKLSEQISFKTFFLNVFKPTIIVLGIGVASIFVSLMNGIALDSIGKDFNSQGMNFSSNMDPASNSQSEGDKTYTNKIENNLLSFTLTHAGKTLLEVVLSIITVIIVYLIISMAVKMGGGNDFVSKKAKSIQDGVGGILGSLPVVPVAGYDKDGKPETHRISAKKTFGIGGRSLLEEKINYNQRKVDEVSNEHNQIISSRFGDGATYLSSTETGNIETKMRLNTWRGLEDTRVYIGTIRDANGKGMTLNPTTSSNNDFWIKNFTNWLNNTDISNMDPAWKKIVDTWRGEKDESKRDLRNLFNIPEYATTYANYFGYEGTYASFDSIKDLDISKGTPTKTS